MALEIRTLVDVMLCWNDGSRSAGSRKEPNKERASGNGMNVWELRSALGANGNADDAV